MKNKENVTNITGNHFIGVKYDAKAVNAIETIALGLVENAKALGLLAQILRASNVELQSLLIVDGPQDVRKSYTKEAGK